MDRVDPADLRKQLLKQALDRIEELEAKLATAERNRRAPIAIVGIGCRFPGGADGPERFWQNLAGGVDAVTEVPADRWDVEGYSDPDHAGPGATYSRQGGFLADIGGFDPLFFGIAPRDAICMDPQHRVLLEVAWEALEHAGQPPTELAKTRTGVFVGITINDYARLLERRDPANIDAYHVTGSWLNFAAGRLSYVLGLQGPAMAVDTACSSSLVAVHLACQTLRLGESDAALACGVNLIVGPNVHVAMSKAQMLSASGRCRTFDASADGLVRAEGCGVLVLRRLDDALAAGDRIIAVIRGSAVNQDGPSSGLTVPNKAAQELVIQQALEVAGMRPHDVGYVEAHGTGTPLGDPIEVRALVSALCQGRPSENKLRVGSVKTNIGHAEAAAGIAGLIKLAMAVERRALPPHLHLREKNPHLDWSDLPIEIPTRLTPWEVDRRVGGVSSFGASGTNAHVIVEEAASAAGEARPAHQEATALVCLSAKNPAALVELAGAYRDHLEATPALELADVAYTACAGRSHHAHRLALTAGSREELEASLGAFLSGEAHGGMSRGEAPAVLPKVAFVFSGQGSQWAGMGRALLRDERVFRELIASCESLVQRHAGFSLTEAIAAPEESSRLGETEVAQPALFALEIALARLFESWGVAPDAVIGHSVGEVAAAHIAGALDLEAAVELVCLRGRVMQQATGLGKMASVAAGPEEVAGALGGYEAQVSIAAINSPRSVVLAGEETALAEVMQRLGERGLESKLLRVNYAFHSPQMDPLAGELERELGRVDARRPDLPFFSTVTGGELEGAQLGAAYWARNVREPVLFGRAVESAMHAGHTLFVEIGPHPVLTLDLEQGLAAHGDKGRLVSTLRRGQDERHALLAALGGIYAAGRDVAWKHVHPSGRLVSLPTYPWSRQRYWLEPAITPHGEATGHPLLGVRLEVAGAQAVFESALSAEATPFLADHDVFGHVIVPGALLVELVHAAGAAQLGSENVEVLGLALQAPLALPEAGARRVQVVLSAPTAEGTPFSIHARASDAQPAQPWAMHASGRLRLASSEVPPPLDIAAAKERCRHALRPEDLYAAFGERGLAYGPSFRGIVEAWRGKGEAVARIVLPEAAGAASPYALHPALLDAALQSLGIVAVPLREGNGAYLPFEVARARVLQPEATEVWAHVRMGAAPAKDAELIAADVVLVDPTGQVVAELEGIRLKRAGAASLHRAQGRKARESLFRLSFDEAPLSPATPALSGRFLLLGDGSPLVEDLRTRLERSGVECCIAGNGPTAQGDAEQRAIDLSSPAAADAALGELEASRPFDGVVCLWGPGGIAGQGASPDAAAEGLATAGLHLVQALAKRSGSRSMRLTWVTQGAQAVRRGEEVALPHASLWGLGRVVMQEHPELGCSLVDLEPGAAESMEWLCQEILRGGDETQVAWRSGKRHAARLLRAAGSEPGGPAITRESTALITGGLGALGLEVARWLWEEHGIEHLLLAGRREPSETAQAAIEALREAGAQVTVAQADVSDPGAVRALAAMAPPELPLRGVVHAAGVLDDGVLQQQSAARFARVFAPKARGAWNLHVETRELDLEFFVLFSSAASVLGSAGQGNYAAANAFLDALAHARHAGGLAGLSVSWGPWSEGGMAERLGPGTRARLARLGIGAISPGEGLALLGRAMQRQESHLAAVPVDLGALRRELGAGALSIWRALLPRTAMRAEAASLGSGWEARLAAFDPAQREAKVESAVRAEAAKVLSLPSGHAVPEERPLQELGLDSLMAVELRNGLSARIGKPLPATLVFDHPTVRALSRHLAQQIAPTAAGRAQADPRNGAQHDDEPIAIVGIGCRYPGGVRDTESFWRLLEDGVDAVREVPPERWNIDAYYDPDSETPGKMITRCGGFLDGIDRFDPAFFGISPREAAKMDPQQRLLLETSWEALESAAIAPERLAGSNAGVFVGLMYNEYGPLVASDPTQLDGYVGTGSAGSVASGRLSYLLGLTGPSMTVDTACSSSLVTVHLACQSLRAGDCAAALAGGVAVMLTPNTFVEFSRLRGLAPDGRCKSFDAKADGVGWSEGCGMLVLKRLSDAQRDRDPILAVIRGTAVNQDGRSNGLTAPNGPSQEAVIRRALERARVLPSAVDYVEAHGTGTALGDPIEVQALGAVLEEGRPADRPVVLGSVKSNLGHTQAAAGAAGIIKVVLALEHEKIPRTLHFHSPNPRVTWDELPIQVAAEAVPWPANGRRRIAGVSSFGVSGTNAHVVLEEPPPENREEAAVRFAGILPLSARSADALAAVAQAYAELLSRDEAPSLGDIGFTASVRRSHHDHRLALVGSDREELLAALGAFARGEPHAGAIAGQAVARPRVAFVFSGQGSQWAGMGRALLDEEPVFREAFSACDERVMQAAGFSLIDTVSAPEEDSRLGQTEVAQPALFATQVALCALLRSWGILPDAVVGHSVGEVAAAHVAGVLSLDEAVRLVVLRAKVMQRATGHGKMAAVGLPADEAAMLLSGREDRLAIAAINDPGSVVLSGEGGALEEALSLASQRGATVRRLQVDYAFHSPQMTPLAAEFAGDLGRVEALRAQVSLYSTVAGAQVDGEALDAAYWERNIREPVRLAAAVDAVLSDGCGTLLEIGPHPVLSRNLGACLEGRGLSEGDALFTLRRDRDARTSMLSALAALHVRGQAVEFERLYPQPGRCVSLPAYPWQRQRYWINPSARLQGAVATGHPLLGGRLEIAGAGAIFDATLSQEASPFLVDHRVFERAVVPGALMVELAHAAGVSHVGAPGAEVAGLTLRAPLVLPDGGAVRIQLVLSEQTEQGTPLAVYARGLEATAEEPWVLHASGDLRLPGNSAEPQPLDVAAVRTRCREDVLPADLYAAFSDLGLDYGPSFRGVVELWRGPGEAFGRIALPESAGAAEPFSLHPALLDAALHVLGAALEPAEDAYLPFELASSRVLRPGLSEAWVHARLTGATERGAEVLTADVTLADLEGNAVAELAGVRLKRADAASLRRAQGVGLRERLLHLRFEEAPLPPTEQVPAGRFLLLGDESELGEAMSARLRRAGVDCVVARRGLAGHGEGEQRAVDLGSPGSIDAALAEIAGAGPLEGVVCLWGGGAGEAFEGTTASAAQALAIQGLHLAQALARRGTVARLLWVTEGAQAVRGGETVAAEQATLWGLGRAIMQEHPELGCALVDLESGAADSAEVLWQEVCRGKGEAQVAWRSGTRHAARLSRAPAPRPSGAAISSEGTALITGGLGALGLEVAQWLWEEHGVEHLVLAGRREPSEEADAAIEALRAAGARVTVAQADVADPAAVRALLAMAPPELPLRWVVHAAGVLDDGVLAQQDAARFAAVFAPKVQGAWNLHVETRELGIDLFVLFSSVASVLGTAGQGNYAAANAFLDGLAQARRASGLAGLSVSWGPWSGGGMAERLDAAQRARLARIGIGAFAPAEGLALLGEAMRPSEPHLVALAVDLAALRRKARARDGEVPPSVRALLGERQAPASALVSGAGAARLLALSPEARTAQVESMVRLEVARALALPAAGEVPADKPLQEMGLDSLMALELRNGLSARLGAKLSATLVFDHPTVAAISRYVLGSVESAPRPRRSPPRRPDEEPIAIVGIGCRYPGGVCDPESFWRLVESGTDAIREVPHDRWDIDALYDPDPETPGKMITRCGGFLDEVDRFDPGFFGIAPREAVRMDPQQRLLLETSWEALERSGISPARLADSDTGVFVGLMYHDYAGFTRMDDLDGYYGTGTAGSVASGRLSYVLGLKGPSMTVDTACSSSLVTVHLACQSLRAGECSAALAGGVAVMLSPEPFVEFSRLRGLAPDGRCKSFDASADGVAWGEGCGMLVLKRLSDARRDGDPILALIRGSAVNQDGRSNGLTAPNGPSQEAVIRRALETAKVAPGSVDYVEAHGTGTPLGDPIELSALGAVLREGRAPDRPAVIGSIKSNIGHTQAAAGVAGIIKVALAMQRGQIPPTLHFHSPNPRVTWSELPLRIAADAIPWPANGRPRIAGVSSFGVSGTNAHVVLQEAPAPDDGARLADERADQGPHVLFLSAQQPEAVRQLSERWAAHLDEHPAERLVDLCFTAGAGRSHFPHRLAVVGGSRDEMRELLSAFARGESPPGVAQGRAATGSRPKVVFVFPGQGSQWLGMCKTLLAEDEAFREAIAACDEPIAREAGFSVLAELQADEATSRLTRIDVLQPLLFAVEVGLCAWWRSLGVEPDAVIGHSMGEVAAAHAAGALPVDDAARVICRRSRLLRRVSGQGAMALVELTMNAAEEELHGLEDRLSVAVSNGPRSTVIGGEPVALDQVLSRLEDRGVFCRRVKVDVASHSPQMDPLLEELCSALAELSPEPPKVPMRSTVTGEPLSGPELAAAYWADNLRRPVRFSAVVQALIDEGHALFVEVSPHPILLPSIQENLHEKRLPGAAVASLRRGADERRCLLESLSALYVHGQLLDFDRLLPGGARVDSAPTYPWQRERYWAEPVASLARSGVARGQVHPLLGGSLRSSLQAGASYWEQILSPTGPLRFEDHRVHGRPVLPGAAYVEMALAAAHEAFGGAPMAIEEVGLERALELPSSGEIRVQAVLVEEAAGRATLQVSSSAEGSPQWTRHAVATVCAVAGDAEDLQQGEAPDGIQRRCPVAVSGAEHYARLGEQGLEYGASFQRVQALWIGDGEAIGRVKLDEVGASQASDYRVHPALLDACFQVLAGLFRPEPGGGPYVPAAIERVRVLARPGAAVWAHARQREGDVGAGDALVADLVLLGDEGEVLAEVRGLRAQRMRSTATSGAREPWLHELSWRPAALPPAAAAPTSKEPWLVFADGGGAGAGVVELLQARGDACVVARAGASYERLGPDLFQVPPDDPEAHRGLLRDAFGTERSCRGALHLWSLDATDPADTTDETLLADQRRGTLSALFLAQALLRQAWRDTPRLWLVTRGAQAQAEGDPVAMAQAPVWGLLRTLTLEHPELRCTGVDLAVGQDAEVEAAALAREIHADNDEDQVALGPSGRLVARILRGSFDNDPLPLPLRIGSEGSYLVTGGLGGLGLSVAQWLVDNGARHLVVLGRGVPSAEAEKAIQGMEASGAAVVAARGDVSKRAEVARVLSEVVPPLRGVVHAAGVLDDRTALELGAESLWTVMAPKVLGAFHLHTLTREAPLDFFVLYSSAASLLGSPGQGNYAAANAYLDALAHHRRHLGLAATSINWGAFAEVGLAAARDDRSARLAHRGVESLTPEQGLEALERLLAWPKAQIGVVKLNPRQWIEYYPAAARSPLWAELLKECSGPGAVPAPSGERIGEVLQGKERDEQRALLEEHVRGALGSVLRLDAARIDADAPFRTLGMDSLMSLELRNRLESSMALRLSAALFFKFGNLSALTDYLLERLLPSSSDPAQAPASEAVDAPLAALSVEGMTAAEAEAALEAQLASLKEHQE